MSLFVIWHLGRKGKLPKPIFDFLNADSQRSKCLFKLKGQAVNLSDGDGMQDPCQLKNHHKIRTTFKLLKESDFFLLKRNCLLKGASNLFELSSYFTYPEFDLSGVFFIHKTYQNQDK